MRSHQPWQRCYRKDNRMDEYQSAQSTRSARSARPTQALPSQPDRRVQRQPQPRLILACLITAALLTGCTPASLPPVDTGAHLQAPSTLALTPALTPAQQLQRMAPKQGLQLPDPLRAVRQAVYEEMVDERGIASWYGPGFHGRLTASGERFNAEDFTAAHPRYAFGTRLCVLSRDGKAVQVRVNDRGPYAKNRIIDLSRAAADALGMTDSGIRRVQLWKLDAEETCADRVDTLATTVEKLQ